MNKVRLVGDIGDRFGHEWAMNVSNYSELLQLIECQTTGFYNYLLEAEENGIRFLIQRADEYISVRELGLSLNNEDIIITAIPMGAEETFQENPSGVGKVIIGVILVVLAFFFPEFMEFFGSTMGEVALGKIAFAIATIGIQLITAGIAEMQASVQFGEDAEANLFQGPVTGIQQGIPVPVLYGELLIGGSPISVAYTTDSINLGLTEMHSIHTGGRNKITSPGDFTAINANRRQKSIYTTLGGATWDRES